ncbi:MAG: hypothetical protein H7Y17_02825 [Chlorobia bacterium]|nr:hypothetical protein [Fimbriimonadaceae bacterium]
MNVKRVYRAIVAVGLAVVVARLAQMIRDLAIAKHFGVSAQADAYFLAVLIPMHLINVVAGSIGVALVPKIIQLEEESAPGESQKLVETVTGITLAALTAFGMIAGLIFPLVAPQLGSLSTSGSAQLASVLLWAMMPMLILSGLATVWSAILTAKEKFALPSIVPVISPFLILLLLPIWPTESKIYALAIGASLGALIEVTILGVALRRRGFRLLPRWYGPELVKDLGGLLVPLGSGAAVLTLVSLLPQFIAAGLSPGSVSVLSYSTKATTLISSIAGVAIATVTQTYFSRLIAANDWTTLRHSLNRISFTGLLILSTITVIVVIASVPLTRLLFERGMFTDRDTQLVSPVQALYALQIPCAALSVGLYRLLAALGERRLLWQIPVGGVFILALLAPILAGIMSVRGLALSVSIFHLVSTFAYWYLLSQVLIPRRQRGGLTNLAVQPGSAQ